MLVFISLLFVISCNTIDSGDCGTEGELSLKLENDMQYYCYVKTIFRDNSMIFKDEEVLLITLYGSIFDKEVTKKDMRIASENLHLIELPKKVREGSLYENKESNEQPKPDYNIIGERNIIIQVPFKGKGVYTSDKVFFLLSEDGKEISKHTPESKDTNIIFNLTTYSVDPLTDKDLKRPEYKSASKERLENIKRVSIAGKITGLLLINNEKKNVTGEFHFSTIMDMPVY
jgi:hypothetical protein